MPDIVNKKIFILALLLLSVSFAKAQMIVAKCDLVKAAAMMPNLGIDAVVGERHTIGVNFSGAKNPWGKDVKLVTVNPEFRYWFGGRPFVRHFVELSAQVTNYDILWNKKAYDGNAFGLGFCFGRSYKLSSRFNIEFLGGISYMRYKQKHFYDEAGYGDSEVANSKGALLFPKASVSVSYIIR